MKSLYLGAPVVLVFAFAACKRPASSGATAATAATAEEADKRKTVREQTRTMNAEAEESSRGELSEAMEAAMKSFKEHDIAEALKALNQVRGLRRVDPEYLTLRGSCYVEQRDFETALRDFQKAAKKLPGNPAIQFNIAEVYFVTKRWDEAIKEFQLVKPSPGPNADTLQALIAFKLMLCEEGRGNANEFDRLAAANLKDADTLLGSYTKAAIEFRDGKKDDAKATLAGAARKFPKPANRAPWHDTMIEFGYDPR